MGTTHVFHGFPTKFNDHCVKYSFTATANNFLNLKEELQSKDPR